MYKREPKFHLNLKNAKLRNLTLNDFSTYKTVILCDFIHHIYVLKIR
jgi:hypothetical protein